jgi:lipocalin
MKLELLFTTLFLIIQMTTAFQKIAACPDAKTVNLDVAKYFGSWYEIGVSPWPRRTFQRNCVCTLAKYSLKGKS